MSLFSKKTTSQNSIFSVRWTILAVGDNGKIIKIWGVRLLILGCIIPVVLALTVILSLYLYGRLHLASLKVTRLENTLTVYQKQVEDQASKIKVLTGRLQTVDFSNENAFISDSKNKPVSESLLPDSGLEQPHTGAHREESREYLSESMESNGAKKSAPAHETNDKISTEGLFRVSFDNIKFFQKSAGGSWSLHFKLENKDNKTLKGYIFVIMKPDGENANTWFSLPSSTLIDKKPDQYKMGRYISISNYKTIRFKVKNRSGLETVQECTILIYATDGNLIASKKFKIKSTDTSAVNGFPKND